MPARPTPPAPILAALAAALFGLAGCAPPAAPLAPADIPTQVQATAGSALLERPDLQHLVERQSRRDTTALVAALTHVDPVMRQRAALGLGSVQARSAIPALLALLNDPDAEVRRLAAFAVGQSGFVPAGHPADPDVTGPLLDALRAENNPDVRRELLHALGRTGDRAALAALVAMPLPTALDADRTLAMARFGLRGVTDTRAMTWLTARLQDPDPEVRQRVAYYLGRLRDGSPWHIHAAEIREATAALSADDPAQMHLALVLARIVDREGHLLRLLTESADWRTRTNAARALAETSDPGAQWALRTALGDPSYHVAVAAAEALAGLDLPETLLADLEGSAFERPMVAAHVLGALARNGRSEAATRGARALALREEVPPYARAAAVRAVATAEGRAPLALLADASADPDARVSFAALDALRARWARDRSDVQAPLYYGVFSEALRRADAATAYAAAPVLADSLFRDLGAGGVMREVYAALEAPRDLEPMLEIVRAQGTARDTSAITFLLGIALEGPHPVLRHAAADALDHRFGQGIDFEPTGLTTPAFPRLDWAALQRLGASPRLILETERGEVELELYTEWAPLTVQAITGLAERGVYDGVPFHRVVPNFVVQGGDFERADGFGGPGYYLPSELTPRPYETGTLGMASAGKDTEGSQFFVTHSAQPHLDGRYTVFGRVRSGQDVVDAIEPGDRIVRARVVPSR